jgi:tripartite-type tricarboxylate transporter receptor subunit TctC
MSTGIEFVHVPYPGGPQIITDLISGRVQAGMDALPNSLPHIRSGTVRALAVMSPRRNPAIPDVPTMSETIPGLETNAGTGIGVPAATPTEIVERLNRDINASLAEPAVKSRYADVGAVPIILTPAEARARIASDTQKWAKVIEAAGLKPE